MFFTYDGKVMDPEATADPVPTQQEPSVSFSAVERQEEARRCYICGQGCPEFATFTSPGQRRGEALLEYRICLHRWCWYYQGGGWEAEKLSRR